MSKTYLIAPFRDKDQVKALGGRWDPDRRQWYVPEGKDLQLFAAWLPSESALPAVTAAGHPPEVGTAGQTLATAAPFPPFAPVAVTTLPTGQVAAPGQMRGVSLSELLSGVSQLVTASFPQSVWVRIEVVAARLQERQGHVYLELAERSDQGALVAKCHAVIWGTQAQRILPEFQRLTGVELAAGIQLLVRARPVFKAQYGFSLEIDAIDAQYTLGDLEAKKRDIRERLQREGLFALNRRLPAPWNYHHVLVIAPQGGAGLGDFQAEASRLQHHGVCQFFYAYSLFQGESASAQIRHEMLAALENMATNHPWSVDAVVIIRGGGAVNDLAWLNDYALARAICELGIPVLTGIGHERDSTVLDEVAHQSLDTPSKVIAAIEHTIGQRVREARDHFSLIAHHASQQIQLARRITDQALTPIRLAAKDQLSQSRRDCERHHRDIGYLAKAQVVQARHDVPAMLADIRSQARQGLRESRAQVTQAWDTVSRLTAADIKETRGQLERHLHSIGHDATQQIEQSRQASQALMREITGQGPQRTLNRGFALVRDSQGRPITRAAELDNPAQGTQPAQYIRIEFADGQRSALLCPPPQPDVPPDAPTEAPPDSTP